MSIPDKAVEAAFDAFSGQYDREHITLILEAAAPLIAAQAWDECSAALGRWGEAGWDWEHGYINEIPPKPQNPYREDAQ